jgi:hypothetical protein
MKTFDKLTEQIFDRQLVSVMNRTKWQRVAQTLTSNPVFNPQTRVQYLDGYVGGFSHEDWDWVKSGDTRVIEWMDIDPIKREHIGRLVEPAQSDFSNWVREALTSYSIPFVEADGLFRINGYLQPSGK